MIHLYFLHGFLGLPSDWEFLRESFSRRNACFVLHFPDLFHAFKPSQGFGCFSKQFNRLVNPHQTNILIGYSLGGRLALHALLDQPSLFSRAVFISTHCGLQSLEQRKDRVRKDAIWSERFLIDEWESLINCWDEQPVFSGSLRLQRKEELFDRRVLADALTHWSLGRQKDLRGQISQVPMPVQWIVGENDKISHRLSSAIRLKNPRSRIVCIEQAGHRLPWDRKKDFLKRLAQFIPDLSSRSCSRATI